MNRQEENAILLDTLHDIVPDMATHDEFMRICLSSITVTLGDISKSLAVIADSIYHSKNEKEIK